MARRPWDLVIFDNDGVLVDSEPAANRVLAGLLGDCGYPVTFDGCVSRFMGSSLARVRQVVEDETGTRLPDDFEDRYHAGLFAAFRAGLPAVAGVVGVLDELDRRGVPFCVASSGTHERIRLALSTVGLLDRFPEDRIFSAEDVAHGKPAPDLFLRAAAQLAVEPSRCLVIEDSPLGVAAARAAGMGVIGYAAMTPADRLADADADAVVETMDELLEATGLQTSADAR